LPSPFAPSRPSAGKVRLAQWFYRVANRSNAPFVVDATLYPERLRFRLKPHLGARAMAYLMNGYEPETTELLDRLYESGTILDVGENIGLIAVPLAVRTRGRADRQRHVIAFEALPSNHQALVWNVHANGLESLIRPLPIALGAERKQVKIQIEGDDPSRTGTVNILPSTFKFRQIDLEIHRLDDLLEDGSIPHDVTLVKIDTDGYDLEVLRGARRLLVEHRPMCHVELNLHCLGWHGQTIDDVLGFAEERRYRLFSQTGYNSGRLAVYEPGMAFFDNALLVPTEIVGDPRIASLIRAA
jgi:FkbM family methyltransferase